MSKWMPIPLAAGALTFLLAAPAMAQTKDEVDVDVQIETDDDAAREAEERRQQMEREADEVQDETREEMRETEQEIDETEQRIEREVEETDDVDTQVYPPTQYGEVTEFETIEEEEDKGIGVGFLVGGGAAGFVDEDVRDFTGDVGGNWEARLIVGSESPVGVEAAYIGNAFEVNDGLIGSSAALVGNGVEGSLRLNILEETVVQPFATVGAAWKHYELTNEDFNFSSFNDSGDVMEIPLGAGVAFHVQDFILDLRGVFRPVVVGDDFVGGQESEMHNWEGNLRLGWEF